MFILRTLWTLLLIFFVLKVTGNIDWSWLWVMSPVWIPVAGVAFLCTYALIKEPKDDGVQDVK